MTSKLALFTTALLLSSAAAQADVSISSKPTRNMSCNAGVCTATAAKAMLNVGDLETMLASGDATVKTGSVALNIEIAAPLTWTGASRLTLDANTSIVVHTPVTVAGQGALTITYNDGGSSGDLLFDKKGSIDFSDLNSSLVVNGASYTLVADIGGLAEAIAANPSGFYALTTDIDASGLKFQTVPVPTEFFGIFDGLGHSILKLRIKHSKECTIDQGAPTTYRCEAFFANVGSQAILRDLALDQAKVISSDDVDYAAVLVAVGGTIRNVAANGSVTGAAKIMGGLAGEADGIVRSTAAVDVSYTGIASGIAVGGLAASSSIVNSSATGRVFGGPNSIAGGLVAGGYYVQDSYATGAVSGGMAGGLAGSGILVSRSFATGAVIGMGGGALAGGLVGDGYDVLYSYARGNVTTSGRYSAAGGLYGQGGRTGTYECCSYSIGAVDAGKGHVGGFLGQYSQFPEPKRFTFEYWDLDTSGRSNGCGQIHKKCKNITGLSDAQLKSGLPAGFDPDIWGQAPSINNGYPYLLANPPPK